MGISGQSVITWIITAILEWLAAGFKRVQEDYARKEADEKANKEVREKVENADTDEELQDALDGAAGRLGRKP